MHFRFVSTLLLAAGVAATLPMHPVRAEDVSMEPADSEDDWDVPAGDDTLDAIIVSATPVPQTKRTLGTSVSRITEADIQTAGVSDLAGALGLVPGANVARTGGQGAQSSLFLRGGPSGYTLVMIDGIPINDVGGGIDLGIIDVDNIESIEVVRGAQTALYGPDSMSGAINIVTKKGEGPPTLRYNLYGGTRETLGGSVSHGFSTDRGHLNVSVSGDMTSNYYGIDNDDYSNVSATARGGAWLIPDVLELDASVRFHRYDLESPGDFRITTEDVDDNSRGETVAGQATFTHHISDIWTQQLRAGAFKRRIDQMDLTSQDPSDFLSNLETQVDRENVDYRHSVTVAPGHVATVGYEYENEDGAFSSNPPGFAFSVQQRLQTHGVYGQLQSALLEDRLHIQLGVRYDHNSGYGGQVSPRIAASYFVPASGTRIHGSWGQGIKNPTIFDLASPFGGNPDLLPEKTNHWDIGVEQTFFDGRSTLDVTYFQQRITNLIQTDPATFMSENIGRARTQGVEITKTVRLNDAWSGDIAYTWTQAVDADGADLLRRPRHAAHIRVLYHPEGWWISSTARIQGESADADFNNGGVPVRNLGFVDYGIAGGYEINKQTEIYMRVDNIFDVHYETAYGFQALGSTFVVGVRGRI